MRTGRLRETITIQQKNVAFSESGQQEITWSAFATNIPAGIETPSGREFFSQNKFNSEISHVVTIRFLDGVKSEMRILWGTRILNIVYPSEDRAHAKTLFLNCLESRN